jgi:hypothetical protein
MSAHQIAQDAFQAAMARASETGTSRDAICRAMLGMIVQTYLETRSSSDVQSELRFVADNCDPDTDFAFMRP